METLSSPGNGKRRDERHIPGRQNQDREPVAGLSPVAEYLQPGTPGKTEVQYGHIIGFLVAQVFRLNAVCADIRRESGIAQRFPELLGKRRLILDQ